MGAACGFFAAVYTFYRFVKAMNWQRAVVCGFVVGLALATKHSVVLLLPILVLLAAGDVAGRWKAALRWPGRDALRILLGLGAIAAIALFVLWGVYSFRYAMHPVGVNMPTLASEMGPLSPLMKRLISTSAHYHLLPESYLFGLADVQAVGLEMPTYIFSRLYAHGQWFYFPVLLTLKWSLGVLGLLALAIYAFATGKVRRPREAFFLALPAVFYLVVAMAGPLNIGVRHILPVFPFALHWQVRELHRWFADGEHGLMSWERCSCAMRWTQCGCSPITCPMRMFFGAVRRKHICTFPIRRPIGARS